MPARPSRTLGKGLSALLSQSVEIEPKGKQQSAQVFVDEEDRKSVRKSDNLPSSADELRSAGDSEQAGESAGRSEVSNASRSRTDGLAQLLIETIAPSPFQPRQIIDEDELRNLAVSVKQAGVMQPILVRPIRAGAESGSGGGNSYELVAGERRWRAARQAGLASVPAIVRDLSDQEAAEFAVIENEQRADLSPIERGFAFRQLMDRFGLSHAEIGERVGLDRSSVANTIRLTALEPAIRELIGKGLLSAGHGKVLLSISEGERRVSLAERCVREGWSVRALERTAEAAGVEHESGKPRNSPVSPEITSLERQLSSYLGTKVVIKRDSKGKGTVTLRFYSIDHFQSLMDRMQFETES